MPNFEQIVRPFQSRQLSPSSIVPPSNPNSVQNVKITVSGGDGSIMTGDYSLEAKWYMTKRQVETEGG